MTWNMVGSWGDDEMGEEMAAVVVMVVVATIEAARFVYRG